MDFKIKQNSELPILELKPYKREYYNELLNLIQNASVTFSMLDDKDYYIIKDKKALINLDTKSNILNDKTDSCKDILDFTIQYHFKRGDTKKIGKYKGEFKIIFQENDEYKTLIVPSDKVLDIEIIK